jgi:hypothetical protein
LKLIATADIAVWVHVLLVVIFCLAGFIVPVIVVSLPMSIGPSWDSSDIYLVNDSIGGRQPPGKDVGICWLVPVHVHSLVRGLVICFDGLYSGEVSGQPQRPTGNSQQRDFTMDCRIHFQNKLLPNVSVLADVKVCESYRGGIGSS